MASKRTTVLRKVSIANLRTAETFDAQFNPEELEESISVNWTRITIPGMSHQVLQYSNTNNVEFSMDFYSTAFTEPNRIKIVDFRNFLESLCYASDQASSIGGGAPPRLLVVWPNVLSMTAVIDSIDFKYKMFDADLNLKRMVASVKFIEIRDTRITSEEVRLNGSRRATTTG